MPDTIHSFERAGLGKGPFRLVGTRESVFVAYPGAPKKPGSSCDYCGHDIMQVYEIESADGRRFKVGSECVNKTGDSGLIDTVKEQKRRLDRRARRERTERIIADAREALGREDVRERLRLAERPNPRPGKDPSMLGYVEWMLRNAGATGQTAAARIIMRHATA